jgi:energy-coupling factor transporter ATP-binding protein EcfA2
LDYAEVDTIRSQFQAGQWPQFLEMVSIDGLRGWTGQSVQFNFPVVAIVGENGSGKSTLLKAATCVYDQEKKDKKFFLSAFFVDTHWDAISGVNFVYRVKRGQNIDSFVSRSPRSAGGTQIIRQSEMSTCSTFREPFRWTPRSATRKLPDWPRLKSKATRSTTNFERVSRMYSGEHIRKRGSPLPTLTLADKWACFNASGGKYPNFIRARVKTRPSTCSGRCKMFPKTLPYTKTR